MATTDTPAPQNTALTGDGTPPAEAPASGAASSPPPAPPPESKPGENPPQPPPPPPDGAKPAGAPEKAETKADLELKLPDGIAPDDAVVAKLRPLAKELGLDSSKAQKLVDLYASIAKEQEATLAQNLDKQQSNWRESAKTDKEIGGGDFERNLQVARKAMTKFATPELREYLHTTGLGDHPEVVRLMVRIGKAIGEDALVQAASGNPSAAATEQAQLRALYPNSPELFTGNT